MSPQRAAVPSDRAELKAQLLQKVDDVTQSSFQFDGRKLIVGDDKSHQLIVDGEIFDQGRLFTQFFAKGCQVKAER
jgi:hypothetical protein